MSVAAPASAAIVFGVNGAFTVNGSAAGTLTGTFTTNDAITQVTAINLQSSANGAFVAYTYNDVAAVDNQQLPNTFRLTVFSPTRQLQLVFSPALTAAGSAIGGNSFENQSQAGNRLLTGLVATQAAAVPEPASWGLMLAGLGLIGSGLRSRRRSTVTYA